ncbi:MAG TPA: hypothetical protein VFY00_06115, partial [Arenimonas sp.]|nr:hypothetical protein [Arenimonas sp.]
IWCRQHRAAEGLFLLSEAFYFAERDLHFLGNAGPDHRAQNIKKAPKKKARRSGPFCSRTTRSQTRAGTIE